MIEKKEYKDWSRKFHTDHSKDPIAISMELTYRCPLRCVHCYSDCYNSPEHIKKELSTEDIKKVMDKLYDAGCLWLAFTGGDPMMRPDFIELYEYAREKGFICTIFTSLVALSDKILEKLIEKPHFAMEMTLNGVTEETYEKISRIKGSYKRVMANIDRIMNAGLPLKIKTLLSKNNIHEKDGLKAFIESRGLTFAPSLKIHSRLNGDPTPCQYRLDVDEVMKLNYPEEDDCEKDSVEKNENEDSHEESEILPNRFYRCAIGNWQWQVSPYGKLRICVYVTEPTYDILHGEVIAGTRMLSDYIKNRTFSTNSECITCDIWDICDTCPGKAKLEVGDEEAPVPYFCELAKRQAEKIKMLQLK